MSGFLELTSSRSGEIKPGASVKIVTRETVRILPGFTGLIGIRKPLADQGLLIGSTLVRGDYNNKVEVHLHNASAIPFPLRVGDPIANIECFENARRAMLVRIED